VDYITKIDILPMLIVLVVTVKPNGPMRSILC
jgi:hypothetical protein